MEDHSNAQVKILEEPAPKTLRFRYECEGRSAGSLPGANSTNEKKTFPKIQVQGYKGRAVVVVSCVTVDEPFRPHPHNLVGKDGCKKGVCTLEISNDDMSCEFSNLGIQCVKKKDVEDSLRIREEIRVDPFRTGFGHKTQPGSIDLNSVRLCFQVFLQGPEHGQFKIPLKPTVSEPIYDKKAICELTIMKLSDCSSPVIGNKEIILLCDKVSKDDIEVRFFEENSEGAVVWEAFGDFQPADVHKQFAISFRTPQYHQLEIDSSRRVHIQLRCPSKDTTSLPLPFDYIPLHTESDLKRKRIKINNSSAVADYVNQVLQSSSNQQHEQQPQSQQQKQEQQPQQRLAMVQQQQPIQVQGLLGNYQLSPQHYPNSLPSPNYQNMQQHGSYSPNPHAHNVQQNPNLGSPGPSQQQQQQQQNPLGLGMTVIKEEWNWNAPTGTSGGAVVGQTVFSPPPPTSSPPYNYNHEQQNHNMSPQHHNININPNQYLNAAESTSLEDLNVNMDNISFPNLSDVNLSLLDNHLSENISGLNLLSRPSSTCT